MDWIRLDCRHLPELMVPRLNFFTWVHQKFL